MPPREAASYGRFSTADPDREELAMFPPALPAVDVSAVLTLIAAIVAPFVLVVLVIAAVAAVEHVTGWVADRLSATPAPSAGSPQR